MKCGGGAAEVACLQAEEDHADDERRVEDDGNEHPETRPVGNGKPGKLFEAIQKLVSEDYESSSFLDDVPYSQYK